MGPVIRATLVSFMQSPDDRLPKPGPIGIAGTGRVAQALGRLLFKCGQPVAAMAGREPGRTSLAAAFAGHGVAPVSFEALPDLASRVLIAVPDDALAEVALRLARGGMAAGVALHTSGARGPGVLKSLAERGVSCGVLHPLQTVATPDQGVRALPGSAFAVVGSGEAAAWAAEIVALLKGCALEIRPEQQPLYHAAAVMASNYIVALVDAAVILMGEAGIGQDTALRALAPLVTASSANVVALAPEAALTGPIERRDLETVGAHLSALEQAPRTVIELYRSAARHTVELARRKNPDADYSALERMLDRPERLIDKGVGKSE
jgi:predicted short-subunit dehydrogenase-like oxidoreductase (DUF2520 family)